MDALLGECQHLKHFNLDEIKSITGDFDDKKVIGRGGFGNVYQGVLSDSKGQTMVALKRLSSDCGQGNPEFLKEIFMLSHYAHENLISLLGFCDQGGEKILVYEHASRGSLEDHLSSSTLTWRQRLKICLGAATGLCYLHDPKGKQERVIHRDVKSSNILLDQSWNAKVSDMGLSKLGPANQAHSFVVTQAVGTLAYIDPMYLETNILTKESDLYSFGLVLFEVLCGKPCFEYNNNGVGRSLVRGWKKSYKEKKLDDIIFHHLKQQMDPSSVETFSEIAYQCLKEYREERPTMAHVVEKLVIALGSQEIFEKIEPSLDYEEMSKTATLPLVYRSEEELKILLSHGILVNDGKMWFSVTKNGEHSEMILAAECLIPVHSVPPVYNYNRKNSRFVVDYDPLFCSEFKIHVKPQFLSPRVIYAVNLVFHMHHDGIDYLGLSYKLEGETKSMTSYIADTREDGWLITELYQFTSDGRNADLEITFQCKHPLGVDGIEFQPLEKVEDEVLEDEEVDTQSDTYWEQKLPSDYQYLITRSKDTVEWTTKKELCCMLCKGFPTNDGEEWFSLSKNGKICQMLPARVVLNEQKWSWGSLPESRFEEVAFDPTGSFWIHCKSGSLSEHTTYGAYLVYKLLENHAGFEPPVKVKTDYSTVSQKHEWYIYLLSPQTPIIRPKFYQKTHNPLNRPNMKGLPQQRDDGWMEVQIWEFQTMLPQHAWKYGNLQLTFSDDKLLKGLIVQGIEFKPI